MDKHQFNVDNWVKRPLIEKDQASIINNPPTDVLRTANAAQAGKKVRFQSLPNVIFAERWSPEIPKDFCR